MTVLRTTVLVDVPRRTVAAAVLDTEVATASAARAGLRMRVARGDGAVVAIGDELDIAVPVLPGLRIPIRTRVVVAGAAGMMSILIGGPLRVLEHRTDLVDTDTGTLVTDTLSWTTPAGVLGRLADVLLLRRAVLRVLAARAQAVRLRAEQLADGPVVVGAVIVRGGRLLAQQRSYPARHAGRWELPGGRVEAGESDVDAIIRECREELGVDVVVGEPVGRDVPLPGGLLLRLYAATLAEADAEPVALEHRALHWVDRTALAELDWLDADRVLLPDLRALLTRSC